MAMAYRGLTAHWLSRALRANEASSTSLLLCLRPAIRSSGVLRPAGLSRTGICQRRGIHSEAIETTDGQEQQQQQSSLPATTSTPTPPPTSDPPKTPLRRLPLMCSGCGAFSQTDDPNQLGYFDVKSKRVRTWLHPRHKLKYSETKEDQIVAEALKGMDPSRLKELGLKPTDMLPDEEKAETISAFLNASVKPPICDRCHNLIHYSTTSDSAKVTMYHPTVESLRETIEESPHKYNHIYHIVDAADFPLSLIPRLHVLLGDISLRTRNRRSRAGKYHKDRQTEMSFIITRSDLLGPTKEMVDAMMPYLREVLREALGRVGERVRLGNVRCVSAKRSWWTKQVREDIWKRGGAGWMVGKVNVGKSQLFEAVYPKGRMIQQNNQASISAYPREALAAESVTDQGVLTEEELSEMDFGKLLPPAQLAKNYPEMPLVSSLPGTTASPIRIPFGGGKGELIDLPGLVRSDLELFVREEHRQSLIMQKRIIPEQVSVKTGKSLILGGGLIRITPQTPNMVFLMYNFTPLEEHLTQTEKAIGFQNQTRTSVDLTNISLPGIADKMKHAGTFKLKYDVTKKRAGPLTRKNAIGLQVDRLPFRVVSVDILIEGVGYVEIVAQVRARDFEQFSDFEEEESPDVPEPRARKPTPREEDPFMSKFSARRDDLDQAPLQPVKKVQPKPEVDWPAVDVYTPEGRFVGSRQPLNGWLNNKPRVLPEHKRKRPRRSMKGQKKKEKKLGRSREAEVAKM